MVHDYYCLFEYRYTGKYWKLYPVLVSREARDLQPIIGIEYRTRLQEEYLASSDEAYLLEDIIYAHERVYVALKVAVEEACREVYIFSKHVRYMSSAKYNLYFDWKSVYEQYNAWKEYVWMGEEKKNVEAQYKKAKKELIEEDHVFSEVEMELANKKIHGHFIKIAFYTQVCS